MKKLLIKLLQNRAKRYVNKYQPTVVGVTGSVGKTSAKQAIAIALQDQVSVRYSEKNYNNEIGLPISIFGVSAPGRSVGAWLSLLFGTLPKAPDIIVLEYGIDHPGDMDALCSIVRPDIAVVTGISPVHAEFFKSIEDLSNEKAKLIEYVSKDGNVILNADDPVVANMRSKSRAPVLTYGKNGDVKITDVHLKPRLDDSVVPGESIAQTHAEFTVVNEEPIVANMKDILGYAPIMSVGAALAVTHALKLDTPAAIEALQKNLHATAGRLRPLAGIKGSIVIDDSYNAAPAAMHNGLDVLRSFPLFDEKNKRIAALGSMAELGEYTENEHRLIGLKVAEVADVFIAVGESMRTAVVAAKEAGMDESNIEWFSTSQEAGRYLDRTIQSADVIYVKGSQSMRMERVVKDIMAEPHRSSKLLVRQEEKWLNV